MTTDPPSLSFNADDENSFVINNVDDANETFLKFFRQAMTKMPPTAKTSPTMTTDPTSKPSTLQPSSIFTPIVHEPIKPPSPSHDLLKDTANIMNIKLLFCSKQPIDLSHIATNTQCLLRTLTSVFPTTLTVFNNHDQPIHDHSAVSLVSFQRNFTIHTSHANLKLSKPFTSWIIFTVHTTESLATIRTHDSIAHVLRTTNSRLSYHPWSYKTSDVVSLGFFVGPIPQYQLNTEFEKTVRTTIATTASIHQSRIPDFRCILSNVSALSTENDSQVTCQAFDLQVERSNVQKMLRLLYKTFSRDSAPMRFTFYRQRHHDPEVFIHAIRLQLQIQKDHRIIAVQGISEAQMFYFEECLRQEFPHIIDVYATARTAKPNSAGRPLGRYNLLCNTSDFVTLAQDLQTRLRPIYLQNVKDRGLELAPDAEPTTVVSRIPASKNTRRDYYDEHLKSWTEGLKELDLKDPLPQWATLQAPPSPPPVSSPPPSKSTTIRWASVIATPLTDPSPISSSPPSITSILKPPTVLTDVQALRAEVLELRRLLESALARLLSTG